MAKLINGNGNPAIYAAEDADLIASLAGNVTCIANVGNKYAATEEDATTIRLDDGVIITKEGRRIQLEVGESDTFYIPTGTIGQTNYYIIGYKLIQNADSTQVAEQFVQKMNSSSETITEDTFRSGATEIYVSVYRVTQVDFTIDSVDGLLPELLDSAAVKDDIDQINSDISDKAQHLHISLSGTEATVKSDLDSAWTGLAIQSGTILTFGNQSNYYYGLLYKYATNIGSIIFANSTGDYVKIYKVTPSGSSLREVLVETNTYSLLNTVNKTILGAINELNSAVASSTFTLTSMLSNVTLSYGRNARWGKVVYVKRIVEFAPIGSGADWSVGGGTEFISGFPKGDWMTDISLVDSSGNFKGTIRINEGGRAYTGQSIGVGTYVIFGTYITTE